MLVKTRLEGRVPKFEDVTACLAMRIGKLEAFGDRYLADVHSGGVALINRILEISALTCDSPARTHFIFASDPDDAIEKETILRKRLIREVIFDLLSAEIQESASLSSLHPLNVSSLPTGHHRLEKKMAAGGISILSIQMAKDHQTSAELILQKWLHRHGLHTANQRYTHLDLLVRTQCTEAYDNAHSDSDAFGVAMLADVRGRLKEIADNDQEAVFGVRYEHLLGIASLATQDCKTWWSKPFSLAEEL
jgi:hypothetical protein